MSDWRHHVVEGMVEDVLLRHPGGTAFFDELDARLSTPYFFDILAESAGLTAPISGRRSMFGRPRSTTIAVSGKFGTAFQQYWTHNKVVLFPGDLRHNPLPPMEIPIGNYIFLDDSCFRGRTFFKIQRAILKGEQWMRDGFVLYDGAAAPLRDVQGIYRWRDRA